MPIKCNNCGNEINISNKALTSNAKLICATYVMQCSKCNSIIVFTNAPEEIMSIEKKNE
ncbi:MAG: hypothetical protein WC376_01470 [Candidatus Nanoarchaeia archaeon]|jgi:hypothetical protein